MLPRNLPLILSPQAEDDFSDILQYTLETWSENQVYVYRELLDNALQTIQQNPYIGQQLPKLSKIHRIFPVGKHIIIYRVVSDAIYVARILHERMNIKRNIP